MRIAIMAHGLRAGGGNVVGVNFINSLREVCPENQFFITVPQDKGYEQLKLPAGSDMFFFNRNDSRCRRLYFETFTLPKLIHKFCPDIIFSIMNFGFANPPVKQAVLLQDSHMLYEKKHYASETLVAKAFWMFHKFRLRKCLSKTQLIFCQTPVMRERFSKVFEYPIERIKIMPNAISRFIEIPAADVKCPAAMADRKCFYIFFLSKYYAHKNPEILFEVFKQYRDSLENVRCVITVEMNNHPRVPRFFDNLKKYKLEKFFINVGQLKQEELANYFFHAGALVFPTLLESFSGTYLEAMHFGLPIITSDLDFARYICGDSAIYFNPWSPESVFRSIMTVKNDISVRNSLKQKGTQRVKSFFNSWISITADVIKELKEVYLNN